MNKHPFATPGGLRTVRRKQVLPELPPLPESEQAAHVFLQSVLQHCGNAWRKERPKAWWLAAACAVDDVHEAISRLRNDA